MPTCEAGYISGFTDAGGVSAVSSRELEAQVSGTDRFDVVLRRKARVLGQAMKSQRSIALHQVRLVAILGSVLILAGSGYSQASKPSAKPIVDPASVRHYFTGFYNDEREMLGTAAPLEWNWFVDNIPWLDVPDRNIEEIYYFRWYSFHKHIRKTPDGWIIDEFIDNVPWAGKFNSINMAAEAHVREARWLRDARYAKEDAAFWCGPDGEARRYSLALADTVYQLYLSTGDKELAIRLLPALVGNYEAWERTHQDPNGLFWQIDDRDGMEDSIGGDGYRPTINSYLYGDAVAISRIADLAGDREAASKYRTKATALRDLIEGRLWNPGAEFYETAPRHAESGWVNVRELIGYVPWYFNLPYAEHDVAWRQLFDPAGFAGRYGPTTAERRSPRFEFAFPHECLWNGPSWPFATTQTLVALANLLNGPEQNVEHSSDYLRLFDTYAKSQHIRMANGRVIPWIDEDLDPDTGEWIARNILESKHQPPPNRGRYYNHSGFADVLITGLIGLRPEGGDDFTVHPLMAAADWKYFAVDELPYHGHLLTILYDLDGHRYGRGAGLQVLCDGRTIAHAKELGVLHVALPAQR